MGLILPVLQNTLKKHPIPFVLSSVCVVYKALVGQSLGAFQLALEVSSLFPHNWPESKISHIYLPLIFPEITV